MQMRINKIVPIYKQWDNPASCIGKGILLECTFKNSIIQMWIVKELRTGRKCQRVFKNSLYNIKRKGGDI